MNKLAIDTSNQVMGIAIMQQNNIIAEITTNMKKDHSSRLMPAIVHMMGNIGMQPSQLDEIVVANGPGSYTGTRIGVTTAKTMAWTLHIPITPISSLAVLALNGAYFNGYICPFFDARRQNVFTGLYKWENGTLLVERKERNIAMSAWLASLRNINQPILFLSPDLWNFKELIEEYLPNSLFPTLNSSHLLRPSNLFELAKFQEDVPVHQIVPNYLRLTEAEANWMEQQKGESKND